MITFWVIAIAMFVVALIFLLRPLLLELKKDDIDRIAQNVGITKERLNELKVEFEQETITQTEYDQTKEELEQALLNDVEDSSGKINLVNNQSYTRLTRYVLLFSVPVFAVSLYAYLGQPELIEGATKQAAAPAEHATSNGAGNIGTLEQMVEKLAVKLKENPDNAEGWFMLGRSYMSMNRYQDAIIAFEKTNQLVPNNPVIMLRYADALTMVNGGQISGKPFELIKKAVELKPDDPTGLWLIGMGYEQQGDYKKAISYWKLLVAILKDDKSINEVNALINQAKSKAGISSEEIASSTLPESAKQAATVSLKVNVSLEQAMLKNVSGDDTVFIFAKAVNGPPMPLAVVRKQVKNLPLEVTLDDSMAMMQTMKISNFKEVQVVARISKSGSPKSQRGDLQSAARVVTTDIKEKVELIINQLVP